ncbi:hypothetical protein FKM82_022352 [Ascaphus truei]
MRSVRISKINYLNLKSKYDPASSHIKTFLPFKVLPNVACNNYHPLLNYKSMSGVVTTIRNAIPIPLLLLPLMFTMLFHRCTRGIFPYTVTSYLMGME